jgi:hypothetical protein
MRDKLDYSDFVTIKIIRVKFGNKPAHWELEVSDSDGFDLGGATGPTFAGMLDTAAEIMYTEPWSRFDANGRKYE